MDQRLWKLLIDLYILDYYYLLFLLLLPNTVKNWYMCRKLNIKSVKTKLMELFYSLKSKKKP